MGPERQGGAPSPGPARPLPWPASAGAGRITLTMKALKAHVRGGRLVIDEPTELPEGTEVDLTILEDDDFDPEERARLDAALERSAAQARAGRLIDGDAVLEKLLARE